MNAKEIYMYVLGALVIICTIIWFAMLMFITVPVANQGIVNLAAGVFLGSGWTQILGYFFGSSKSSADKNATIDKQLNQTPSITNDPDSKVSA